MSDEPELVCEVCGTPVSPENVQEARARVRAFGLPSDAQRWQLLRRLGRTDTADVDTLVLCPACAESGLTWVNVD